MKMHKVKINIECLILLLRVVQPPLTQKKGPELSIIRWTSDRSMIPSHWACLRDKLVLVQTFCVPSF